MGGPGSGSRWRVGARLCTDDYRKLDVRRLAREGMLRPGNSGGWQWTHNDKVLSSIQMRAEADWLTLMYRHRERDGDWQDKRYRVYLARTPCNLGGSRPWFICPANGCGRRVAILYGGGIFACRRCYRLAYPSTREDSADRFARRADRLRKRLGWDPGMLNGHGDKPKWMRWETFLCLIEEHDRFVEQSLRAATLKFGLPSRWLP